MTRNAAGFLLDGEVHTAAPVHLRADRLRIWKHASAPRHRRWRAACNVCWSRGIRLILTGASQSEAFGEAAQHARVFHGVTL